jgi:hypothetical protein
MQNCRVDHSVTRWPPSNFTPAIPPKPRRSRPAPHPARVVVEALRNYAIDGSKLHAADETGLAPSNGKTKTGRLWTYVRDESPSSVSELFKCYIAVVLWPPSDLQLRSDVFNDLQGGLQCPFVATPSLTDSPHICHGNSPHRL